MYGYLVDKLIELIEKHMVLSLMRSDHREEMGRIYNNSINAARACQQIRRIFRGEEIMTEQSQSQQQPQPQPQQQQQQQPQIPQIPEFVQSGGYTFIPQPQQQYQQYAPQQHQQYAPQQYYPNCNSTLTGELDSILADLSQLSNLVMGIQRKIYEMRLKLK